MRIDIWSDVMCPFCYIGKRKLEGALKDFEHAGEVEVIWHSFQLDPAMTAQPGKNVFEYLAERKGQSLEWSVKMHEQVSNMAKTEGLDFAFDKAVIANSYDAHRLLHLAKKHGKGSEAKEAVLRAYFTEGRDVADHNTLMQIGIDLGLRVVDIGEMLNSDTYAGEVNEDIAMAGELGINGVPFFVIDNKYAISGAQPVDVFRDGLQHAWQEYEQNITVMTQGNVCGPDGICETN